MKFDIRTILLLAAITSGCSSVPKATTEPAEIPAGPSVIYIGMSWDIAQAKFEEYHAEQCWTPLGLSAESTRRDIRLEKYRLPTGVIVNVATAPWKTGRAIADISVSTYIPQSWEDPQNNPEYLRFIRSFKKRKAFDLTSKLPPPNKLPWPGSRMRL